MSRKAATSAAACPEHCSSCPEDYRWPPLARALAEKALAPTASSHKKHDSPCRSLQQLPAAAAPGDAAANSPFHCRCSHLPALGGHVSSCLPLLHRERDAQHSLLSAAPSRTASVLPCDHQSCTSASPAPTTQMPAAMRHTPAHVAMGQLLMLVHCVHAVRMVHCVHAVRILLMMQHCCMTHET